MKNLNSLLTIFFVVLLFSLGGCATDELEIPEENTEVTDIESNESLKRIASTKWDVQTLGKSYKGIGNRNEIKRRFKNNGSSLWMKVVRGDGTTPNSRYSRTELRSRRGNFSTKTTHNMNVTMEVIKSTKKVIIGQIFDQNDGDDYGVVYLSGKKMYAQFDGQSAKKLSDNVGKFATFSIRTKNGKTTISGEGKSISRNGVRSNCYFKTGVYLQKDSGSAEVRITKLSQN